MRILLVLMVWCGSLSIVEARPNWRWEHEFTTSEKERLTSWIRETEQGLVRLFGRLPYSYDVHFFRRFSWREPVPWANTSKSRGRAVRFHVDLRHSQSAFISDWTASHELAHLMFPYLGDSGRWFAEGIASYLQYQIMYANGVLTWDQAIRRYRERFSRANAASGHGRNLSIIELGRTRGSFVRLYWGGGAFFLTADQLLYEETGQRLTDVIHRYMHCCYTRRASAESMIRSFDRISGSNAFSRAYDLTVSRPGFPKTADALDWLQDHPPAFRE